MQHHRQPNKQFMKHDEKVQAVLQPSPEVTDPLQHYATVDRLSQARSALEKCPTGTSFPQSLHELLPELTVLRLRKSRTTNAFGEETCQAKLHHDEGHLSPDECSKPISSRMIRGLSHMDEAFTTILRFTQTATEKPFMSRSCDLVHHARLLHISPSRSSLTPPVWGASRLLPIRSLPI